MFEELKKAVADPFESLCLLGRIYTGLWVDVLSVLFVFSWLFTGAALLFFIVVCAVLFPLAAVVLIPLPALLIAYLLSRETKENK